MKLYKFNDKEAYRHCLYAKPFRIFYNLNGDDKTPKELNFTKDKSIPDYILNIKEAFENAYTIYTKKLHLINPLKEGIYYNKGACFIDILIADIPIQKGLVAAELIDNSDYFSDDTSMYGKSIRILLDKNLIKNTATPIHELFHVFQYNYCHFNNMWFMEGLARWSQNLTHKRALIKEVLPSTLGELNDLISRTHDAEYFWRELITKCDHNDDFVKILLEQCILTSQVLENQFKDTHRYNPNSWLSEDKKSPLNNQYIFEAILNTINILNITPDSELKSFINVIKKFTEIIRIPTLKITSENENDLKQFDEVQEITGDLLIDTTSIKSLNSFHKLKKVNNIIIKNNKSLQEIIGFNALESIQNIEISNNPFLEEIYGFSKFCKKTQKINGFIKIVSNKNLKSISFLSGIKSVGSSFYLHHNDLEDIDGLEKLEYVGASFSLASNKISSVEQLKNLESIDGTLSLVHNNLTSLNGLENLTKVETRKWNNKNRTIAIFGNKELYDISSLKNVQTDDNYIIIETDSYKQYTILPEKSSFFNKNILEIHDKNKDKIIPTYLFRDKKSHNYENFRNATHNKKLDYLLDFELDSDTLVISFSGFNGFLGGMFHNRYPYITDDIDTHKIFINDKSNLWYQNGIPNLTKNIDETIELIQYFVHLKHYKKIICFGASMGGYMALLTGKLIGATDIFAISPQTFLDRKRRIKYNDNRWKKEIDVLNKQKNTKYLNLKEIYAKGTNSNIQIHYASKLTLDKIHAEYLGLDKKYLIAHDLNDHYLAVYLHKNGALKPLIENILTSKNSIKPTIKPKILFGYNWKKATKAIDWMQAYHTDFNDIDNAIKYASKHHIKILFANNYKTQSAILKHQKELRKLGLKFIVNSKQTLKNLADKQLFYEIMFSHNLGKYVPKYYSNIDEVKYPCMVKRKSGGAGRDMFIAYGKDDLKNLQDNIILSEYLPSNTEYATSVFSKNGTILNHITFSKKSKKDIYILQHEKREDIKIARCDTPFLELFENIVKIMSGEDKYCQCSINFKIENNIPKIFEINPRIGYTLAGFPNDFKKMIDSYMHELGI